MKKIVIDNFNYIKIFDNNVLKKEYNLCVYNINSPLKILSKYLSYIKDLIEKSYKNNKYIDRDEFIYVIYNTFLYFLINWDNLYHTNLIPFYIWYNFKEIIDNILKSEKEIDFILDQKYVNTGYFKRYLKNFTNNIRLKNKNKIMDYIMENFQGYLVMLYFLARKIIMNKKNNYKFDVLFINDYDRYYKNNRFFGSHLFKNDEFKKLLESFYIDLSDKNYSILFTKYNYVNLPKYIKDYYKKGPNYIFIEDVLDLKLGFEILLNSSKIYKKMNLNNNDDEHKKFINEMFNIFLKHKLPFILWFYLSIKNYTLKNNIKCIIGDSEKNFMFYLFMVYCKYHKDLNIKTIAFSHEIISKNYIYLPLSNDYDLCPDIKLVWNNSVRKLLIEKYNYPKNKVKVFPDPRFLYWKNLNKKSKSILLVSQGYPEFYDMIFKAYKEGLIKSLVDKGYKIYFKPHPAEFNFKLCVENYKKLKTLKNIKTIDNLSFLPEYAIGMSSTLLYELYMAGSKTYFLDKKAKETFMIDDKEFEKIYKNNLIDIFKKLNNIKI